MFHVLSHSRFIGHGKNVTNKTNALRLFYDHSSTNLCLAIIAFLFLLLVNDALESQGVLRLAEEVKTAFYKKSWFIAG